MVNLGNGYCEHSECGKFAGFGEKAEGIKRRCLDHKIEGKLIHVLHSYNQFL